MKFGFFNTGFKNFRWRSFFFKYFVIVFSLIFALIASVFALQTYNAIATSKMTAANDAVEIITKSENMMTRLMDETIHSYSNFSGQENFYYFLLLPEENATQNPQLPIGIKHTVSNYAASNDHIYSIYVYSSRNNYVISSASYQSTMKINDFDDNEWFYAGQDLLKEYIIKRTINIQGVDKTIISLVKPLYYGNIYIGNYVINYDAKSIKNTLLSVLPDTHFSDNLYLINSKGDVLCSTGATLLEKISENDILCKFFGNSTSTPEAKFYSKTSIVAAAKLQQYGIGLVLDSKIPTNYGLSHQQIIAFCIALFASLAAGVIIAFLLTSKFYSVILDIMDILQNPESEPHNNADNEFGLIRKNISSLTANRNAAEQELAHKIKNLKQLEAAALQSQLNPHFIYNVLHLISSYEMMEHKCDTNVTIAIGLFSDLLRSAMDNKNSFVTLSEEIDLCKNYLEIANLFVQNKFDTVIDIPEELYEHKVLKLSLQPVLENAVMHGVRRVKHKGIISIKVYLSGNTLMLEITDNGKGMTADELASLRKNLELPFEMRNSHLGLYNTNHRIRLMFGNDFGCRVNSDENGTCVIISTPDIYENGTKK